MTRHELNDAYFSWMCQLVRTKGRKTKKTSYSKLLSHLHAVDFDYIIPMDGNRAEDGINLRYRFGYEESYSDSMVASYLDDRPCSVLEMMIALAMKCEEHIMCDSDIGDRTGEWFWTMIRSLGLEDMNDADYDADFIDSTIIRFLNREYSDDGEGGLFTVSNCTRDMRDLEIWYQMQWYLNEIV